MKKGTRRSNNSVVIGLLFVLLAGTVIFLAYNLQLVFQKAGEDQDSLQLAAEMRAASYRVTALSREAVSGQEEAFAELQAVASDSIVLWDFSGDSPYIHEPLPEAHARGQSLQWFWEPAHYTKALGNVMLPVMLPANCQPAEHFGVQRYPAVKP